MSTPQHTLLFSAMDTLFFRENRPHERVGGTELGSLFPPPVRTLLGAVRTSIGRQLDADWERFAREEDYQADGRHLRGLIGYADDLGPLRCQGPWLHFDGERLYPLPQNILGSADAESLLRLEVGPALHCDLGRAHLPVMPQAAGSRRLRPLADTWVNQRGLQAVLNGGTPQVEDCFRADQLFGRESRIGIGRDVQSRTTIDGRFFQTGHIRPHRQTRIALDIDGLDDTLAQDTLIRLGAEGRSAHMRKQPCEHPLPPLPDWQKGDGLILYLLTPAFFKDAPDDQPFAVLPGLHALSDAQNTLSYRGSLLPEAAELEQVSAVIGRPLREGGWDMARRRPRKVNSLIPAGSLWYCRSDDPAAAATALHGRQIGSDTELGRGLLAVGRWPLNEMPQ